MILWRCPTCGYEERTPLVAAWSHKVESGFHGMTAIKEITNEKPLQFSYDVEQDILTIEGCKYSGVLFRALGLNGIETGKLFEIVDREDGVITLKRHEKANDIGQDFCDSDCEICK